MVEAMAVVDTDEWLHPPDGSAGWSEDMAFAIVDIANATHIDVGLVLHLDSDAMRSTASWRTTVAGRSQYSGAWSQGGPPRSNWDVMAIGAVELRMEEGLVSWSVRLEDNVSMAFLVLNATGACIEMGPTADGEGWYEQDMTVTGEVHHRPPGGEKRRIVVDGVARRLHRWGHHDTTTELSVAGHATPPVVNLLADLDGAGDVAPPPDPLRPIA